MISDFGLSKIDGSGTMATACGTPGYVGWSLVISVHKTFAHIWLSSLKAVLHSVWLIFSEI